MTTDLIANTIFFEIVAVVLVATTFGYFVKIFKQPLLPAFIFAGFLLGPGFASVFGFLNLPANGIISDTTFISTLSTIGLAFLMFISGLEIDLRSLKDVGRVCLYGALIQFILLAGIATGLGLFFFDFSSAFHLAVAIAFSSTALVIKILSDNGEIDSLHGRIIVGFLLIQDVLGIIMLGLLANTELAWHLIFLVLIKGAILCGLAYFCARYVFNNLFSIAARSGQLLFLTSIAVCFMFAFIAVSIGDVLIFVFQNPLWNIPLSTNLVTDISAGFSMMIGAYLAGMSLGNLQYSSEIVARIIPLRDFFILLFFVSLGLGLSFSGLLAVIVPFIVFMIFLLIIKPIVTAWIVAKFGYERKTSFHTGLNLFQTDTEFGIILLTATVANSEVLSLITLLMVATMALTPYVNKYEEFIYAKTNKFLPFLGAGQRANQHLEYKPDEVKKEIVLVGCGRTGYHIIKTLTRLQKNFLVVDFNPEIIKELVKEKIHCLYGNAGDIEIIKRLHLEHARVVISTVPGKRMNMMITHHAKQKNPKCLVFATAYNITDAIDLYDAGADYVVLPHHLGGAHVSFMLEDILPDFSKILKHKNQHISELLERNQSSWGR